ncbi:MAG: enoyl-CoA hydratase-related protein [Spirochaetota bacterium]|nr:enoyl-CoA hydratase-related protein [Spirochaetota bacterium]
MKGPINLVRSDKINELANKGPVFEWSDGITYLIIDKISYKDKFGAILCYFNPPVHQVGNPGLDAYLKAMDSILKNKDDHDFFIIYGSNDPVHAGGDLKESLSNLDKTTEIRKEHEAKGVAAEEIDKLYNWADDRLKKGISLHSKIREISQFMRVVSICGGGTRFGGSAEIPLMADYIVGDSRSGICFSEAQIGLIPGWGGIGRTLIKSGRLNAEYMARTSKEIKADQLKKVGIYNIVVDVPFPFPKKQRTDNPDSDKAVYLNDLEEHDDRTGMLMLPKALELAVSSEGAIPVIDEGERLTLATEDEITNEIKVRSNPETYSSILEKPLKEAKEEIARLGKPLAPQSILALDDLFKDYDPSNFDEIAFVKREMEADARLYRDSKFRAGLIATLNQLVADYR